MPKKITTKVENLYLNFKRGFLAELQSDDFYNYFLNALRSGERNVSLYEKFVERNVDLLCTISRALR